MDRRKPFKTLLADILRGQESAGSRRRSTIGPAARLAIGEDGMVTLATLVAVLFLLVLLALVTNVAITVSRKIHTQNSVDAVAYSGSVGMARSLNAITAANHLTGELTALIVLRDAIGGEHVGEISVSPSFTVVATVAKATKAVALIGGGGAASDEVDIEVNAGGMLYDARLLLYKRITTNNLRFIPAFVLSLFIGSAPLDVVRAIDKFQAAEATTLNNLYKVARSTESIGRLKEITSQLNKFTAQVIDQPHGSRIQQGAQFIATANGLAASDAALFPERPQLPVKRQHAGNYQSAQGGPYDWPYNDKSILSPDDVMGEIGGMASELAKAAMDIGVQLLTADENESKELKKQLDELAKAQRKLDEVRKDLQNKLVDMPVIGDLIGKNPSWNELDKLHAKRGAAQSQWVRATYPWVATWRVPLLNALGWMRFSAAAEFYKSWTDNYAVAVPVRLMNAGGFMFVMSGSTVDNKGSETWTNSPSEAEQLFSLFAAARQANTVSAAPSLFDNRPHDFIVTYAQAITYNANATRDLENKSAAAQPIAAWDTLNWQPPLNRSVPEVPLQSSPQTDVGLFEFIKGLASGGKFYSAVDPPHIKLNWQAKLVPVTRLEKALPHLDAKFSKVLAPAVPQSANWKTH